MLLITMGLASYLIFQAASAFVYEEEAMRHEILLNEAVEKDRKSVV